MPCSKSLTLAALTVALLAGGCDRQSSQNTQPQANASPATPAEDVPAGAIDRSHKGSPLPDLTFKGPSGQTLKFASLVGKPLLVNFWATWCGPCVAELPTLHKLATRPDIKVIAVSEDLGDASKVSAFWQTHGLNDWTLWLDPENAASSKYAFATLPTTIFYDATGHEVWRFTGGRDWTSAASGALLKPAGA